MLLEKVSDYYVRISLERKKNCRRSEITEPSKHDCSTTILELASNRAFTDKNFRATFVILIPNAITSTNGFRCRDLSRETSISRDASREFPFFVRFPSQQIFYLRHFVIALDDTSLFTNTHNNSTVCYRLELSPITLSW